MIQDSTSFLIYTVPSNTYQQDIFLKNVFLVLCLFVCMVCTVILNLCSSVQVLQYVLLFQPIPAERVLLFTVFEYYLITSVDKCCCYTSFSSVRGDTFCFPDVAKTSKKNKDLTFLVLLSWLDI